MEDENINLIISLYGQNDWKKILKLNEKSKTPLSTRLLWVWPTKKNLKFMQEVLIKNQVNGVISIGCGTGLFEWLLHKYTNLPVIGYEVNKEWWTSKYSMPQFIQVQFLNMPPKSEYLSEDYALLFCYFNNGPAFQEYIDVYTGSLIFIIGPGKGRGTHTNPDPFKPNIKENWKLCTYEEVGDTKDVIAVYCKI
ncbi:hypothetical protein RN001_001222 [Aquatica leii]|uniref:Uncharacterized protein n=1 Tax=Aquatica leii TaxID=1421715 RepID=A0AAN7PL04_9COLE|nr:hypothetical protein RN001_001222 [Aquatica leii]